MNLRKALTTVLAAVAVLAAAAQDTPVSPEERAEVTRAVGTVLGSALRSSVDDVNRLGVDVDRDLLISTIIDVINNRDTGFTRDQANQYVENYINRHYHAPADTVSTESQQAFLAEAAAKPNTVTTPSGLVFRTVQEGVGPQPTDTDMVVLSYKGTLSDGTVFDETDEGPIVFDMVNLTPGFIEGLKMMRPGGKYVMTIPSDLMYGVKGIPGIIPGNAALEFEVELVEIQ